MKRSHLAICIVIIILLIDQVSKVYIKTNFHLGEAYYIFGWDWAQIRFIENPGMAFGMNFGGIIGKYILSIFRIFMAGFLIYFIIQIIKSKQPKGLVVSFALILAGAIGNIIDSMFYGLIFSDSEGHVAMAFPPDGGYASFLQGKVVDMFYFPMIKTHLPTWLPFKGGDYFEFFSPIFNVADSAIFVGVVLILLFYRSFFVEKSNATKTSESETTAVE